MVALIVILSFFLLIICLLLFPVAFSLEYHNGGSVLIKYLFIKINLPLSDYQNNEGKKPKEKNKKQASKKDSKDTFKKQGIAESAIEVLKIIKTIVLEVFNLLGKIKIEFIKLDITFGQNDAAETGILYGVINAAVCSFVAVINAIFPVQKQKININSDFDHEILDINFNFKCHVTPIKIIFGAFKILFKLLKAKIFIKG